jgi:hypothetical protein
MRELLVDVGDNLDKVLGEENRCWCDHIGDLCLMEHRAGFGRDLVVEAYMCLLGHNFEEVVEEDIVEVDN